MDIGCWKWRGRLVRGEGGGLVRGKGGGLVRGEGGGLVRGKGGGLARGKGGGSVRGIVGRNIGRSARGGEAGRGKLAGGYQKVQEHILHQHFLVLRQVFTPAKI